MRGIEEKRETLTLGGVLRCHSIGEKILSY